MENALITEFVFSDLLTEFNGNHAKILLALLDGREKDSKELWRLTKIPCSRFFKSLDYLIEKDLLFKKVGRQVIFSLTDPLACFDLLLQKKIEMFRLKRRLLVDLINERAENKEYALKTFLEERVQENEDRAIKKEIQKTIV